jgi:cell wall-associated NlpC family hydrolase
VLARLLFSAFLPLAVVFPAAAQWSLTSHLASDGTMQGSPFVAGASLSSLNRRAGLRIGFGLDAGGTPVAEVTPPRQSSNRSSMTLDFDGMYYPIGAPKGAGLAPYGFLGLGGRAWGSDREVLTGSFGSGVDVLLSRHFGIQVEARRRMPLSSSDEAGAAFASGWELRVGLSLRISGKSNAAVPAKTKVPRRPVVRPVYVEPTLPETSFEETLPARISVAARTISMAEAYVGVPYKWGGSTPAGGFDCSGFVQYVYREYGITLPRVSREQAMAGTDLPTRIDALEAGDLMFFSSNGRRVDHVAIYAGEGRILHSSKSGGGVGYDNLWSRRGAWFRERFVEARRIIEDDRTIF